MVCALVSKPTGDITTADALAVTAIDLSCEYKSDDALRVADLSGLGYFTNLQDLYLGFHRVTDIGLQGGERGGDARWTVAGACPRLSLMCARAVQQSTCPRWITSRGQKRSRFGHGLFGVDLRTAAANGKGWRAVLPPHPS